MCLHLAAGSGATASSSRNLWVSGLSSTTRATDLKTLFSKYGKVSLFKLSLAAAAGPRIYKSYIINLKVLIFCFYFSHFLLISTSLYLLPILYLSVSCRLLEQRWWPTPKAPGLVAMVLSPCLPQRRPPTVSATFTGLSCMAGWSLWSGWVMKGNCHYSVVNLIQTAKVSFFVFIYFGFFE